MGPAALRFSVLNLGLLKKSLISKGATSSQLEVVKYISGKALRTEERVRPAPWPYMEKGYSNWNSFFDHTSPRFDDNTKVIFVEGMPAIGKTEFATKLADELEMRYFPMVTTDFSYILPDGFDMRSIDSKIPKSLRSVDEKAYFNDPTSKLSIRFQLRKLILKSDIYIDALVHLLNTGQGVVMDRSPYSDFVFAEAMYRAGQLSKEGKKCYKKFFESALKVMLKPHLVIYLDASKETVAKNIAKRALGDEKAMSGEFLETMEEEYKYKFLRDIETHAELLIYDWNEPGDVEVVVEDIERIKFDRFEEDFHNPKMKNWRFVTEADLNEKRHWLTNYKLRLLSGAFSITNYEIPELWASGDDTRLYREYISQNVDSIKYDYGWNPKAGISTLLKRKSKNFYPALGTSNYYFRC